MRRLVLILLAALLSNTAITSQVSLSMDTLIVIRDGKEVLAYRLVSSQKNENKSNPDMVYTQTVSQETVFFKEKDFLDALDAIEKQSVEQKSTLTKQAESANQVSIMSAKVKKDAEKAKKDFDASFIRKNKLITDPPVVEKKTKKKRVFGFFKKG
jgi:archaellin